MSGAKKVTERLSAKGTLAISIKAIQRSLAVEIHSYEMESV
jgi:hypothetical protein